MVFAFFEQVKLKPESKNVLQRRIEFLLRLYRDLIVCTKYDHFLVILVIVMIGMTMLTGVIVLCSFCTCFALLLNTSSACKWSSQSLITSP